MPNPYRALQILDKLRGVVRAQAIVLIGELRVCQLRHCICRLIDRRSNLARLLAVDEHAFMVSSNPQVPIAIVHEVADGIVPALALGQGNDVSPNPST